MHKDPPPTLFDGRRPLVHVITHGLIAGFIVAVVVHFGWSLWQNSSGGVAHHSGTDALVSGIQGQQPEATTSPAIRY
ncbi:MAG TPA: hypothetical protein VGC85_06655 [Chthoniobacterales bacterium]